MIRSCTRKMGSYIGAVQREPQRLIMERVRRCTSKYATAVSGLQAKNWARFSRLLTGRTQHAPVSMSSPRSSCWIRANQSPDPSGREVAAAWLLCVFIAVLALGATRGLHNSEPPAATVANKTAIRWHSRAVCTPLLPCAEGVTAILEPWSTISSVRLGAPYSPTPRHTRR
jgi:hypothetical protein